MTFFQSAVVMSDAQALTAALWVLFAHVSDAFQINPILEILAPTPRSGKTTLLERVGFIGPRTLTAGSFTGPSLFRAIEKWHPTLVLDEMDLHNGQTGNDLEKVLITGLRRRTAYVLRCDGQAFEPKRFSSWCPKVIATTGKLASSALNDRAITIRLARATASELAGKQRESHVAEDATMDAYQAQAALWAGGVSRAALTELEARRDTLPAHADSRFADLWSPLLAVVDLLDDPALAAQAREAALSLIPERAAPDEEPGIRLLLDCKGLFGDGERFIASGQMVERLRIADPYGPWATLEGKGLTTVGLAKRLKGFGIRPSQQKAAGRNIRGYASTDFDTAIARYVGTAETEPASPDPTSAGLNPYENLAADGGDA